MTREPLTAGFRIGEHAIEPMQCRIVGPAGEVHVEPRTMDVLVALAQRAGEAVSRDDLILTVWKHPHVTDEALSRCISLLRQALGDSRESPRFVETIPKRGYRLISPVQIGVTTKRAAPLTIAVLPFVNLSGDPAEEHLVDAITELLITNLACLSSLRVISRTSSMHYKATRTRLTEIARELDVERIVEGSVLRSPDQIQVIVQVIDPQTDTHLFTRSYTRQLADLLKLQNEMAWTIAEEIGATLQPAERARLPMARPLSEEGMLAYVRARHFWAQRTPDSFGKAIREYEKCLAVEPDYAPAYAGLADTLTVQALYGIAPPGPLYMDAKHLAERALALDPTSAEALKSVGAIKLFFEWDFAAAEPLLRRALGINPSYEIAHLTLADLKLFRHDFDAALRELHAAVRLNPFDLGLQMNYGQFLLYAHRRDEAVAQLKHTLDIGPHFWPARCLLAEAYAIAGMGDAAKHELERAREDIPVARIHQPLAIVHALLGESAQARATLASLEATRGDHYVPPWELARGYAALGDADTALRWIEMGIEERAPAMLGLDTFPGFDRIRGDPRFVKCLMRIGLPT